MCASHHIFSVILTVSKQATHRVVEVTRPSVVNEDHACANVIGKLPRAIPLSAAPYMCSAYLTQGWENARSLARSLAHHPPDPVVVAKLVDVRPCKEANGRQSTQYFAQRSAGKRCLVHQHMRGPVN